MPAPLRPAAVQLYGSKNWIFVPTIASATLAPTVAEATGASALDITDILFADTGQPTKNTNVVDQERRYGDTLLFQFIGTTAFGGGELHYQFNPQGAAASNGVKAYEKFTAAGTTGFLVNRGGIAKATNVIAAQFVDSYPVQIGPSFPVPAGEGESEEAGMGATFVITAAPAIHIAVLA